MSGEVSGALAVNAHALTLRAARPTREDGLVFARHLDVAAEGFFRVLLGRDSEGILARAFVQPGHDLSYRHVTLAERDGRVVGMASAYTAEEHRLATHRPLEQAAGRRRLRIMVLSLLFAPILRRLGRVDDGESYLLALAVDGDVRGSGVGSALIDSVAGRARDGGSTRLALDVTARNAKARRFYEGRGFTVASRWPKRLPGPGITLYRMTRAL